MEGRRKSLHRSRLPPGLGIVIGRKVDAPGQAGSEERRRQARIQRLPALLVHDAAQGVHGAAVGRQQPVGAVLRCKRAAVCSGLYVRETAVEQGPTLQASLHHVQRLQCEGGGQACKAS